MKLVILFSLLVCSQAYKRYDDYKVIQVTPQHKGHLLALKALQEQEPGTVDFWKETARVNGTADIMVAPQDLTFFNRFLAKHGMPATVVVDNVQNLVDAQKSYVDNAPRFKKGDDPKSFAIDQYHSVQEIYDWIDSLAEAYPDLISSEVLGQSFEKRDLKLVKIGTKSSKQTSKPISWIDAGMHANEWISGSTGVYIINELVTKYNSNPTYKELVDKIDFRILPFINPDGYEYTRKEDRLWRKTRSGPYFGRKNEQCYGADPNRNWDFKWGVSGASRDPCSTYFIGKKPFSEPECKVVSDYLLKNKDRIKTYLTLHSYADALLYSYGYADHTYPSDVDELKSVGKDASAAIKAKHGVQYDVGSPADILSAASGCSDDWSKAVPGIKWVYTIELRPGPGDKDDQHYGDKLPPSFIIPVGEEAWAGLQVIIKKLID